MEISHGFFLHIISVLRALGTEEALLAVAGTELIHVTGQVFHISLSPSWAPEPAGRSTATP